MWIKISALMTITIALITLSAMLVSADFVQPASSIPSVPATDDPGNQSARHASLEYVECYGRWKLLVAAMHSRCTIGLYVLTL